MLKPTLQPLFKPWEFSNIMSPSTFWPVLQIKSEIAWLRAFEVRFLWYERHCLSKLSAILSGEFLLRVHTDAVPERAEWCNKKASSETKQKRESYAGLFTPSLCGVKDPETAYKNVLPIVLSWIGGVGCPCGFRRSAFHEHCAPASSAEKVVP